MAANRPPGVAAPVGLLLVPAGRIEKSPPFQRWVDGGDTTPPPGVETPGYVHAVPVGTLCKIGQVVDTYDGEGNF